MQRWLLPRKTIVETGIGHLKQHRYEAAVNVFTELIEMDPDNPDVYKTGAWPI